MQKDMCSDARKVSRERMSLVLFVEVSGRNSQKNAKLILTEFWNIVKASNAWHKS